MKKLIFLPIDLEIINTDYSIESRIEKTFGGLWDTKFVSPNNPQLTDIIKQLPYQRISLIKYNSQATDIPPHIDVQPSYIKIPNEYEHIISNEPAGYRILLSGKIDKLEVFDGKIWRTAQLPVCPFAYVINSTETKHRVIGETGRKTLYFRGFLDPKKHRELINKNLERFKEYAIYAQ